MPAYRCAWHPGGTWFFTVNALRRGCLLIRHIGLLRQRRSGRSPPASVRLHSWVVLAEHMHCVMELPWIWIRNPPAIVLKAGFSKGLRATERRSAVPLGAWRAGDMAAALLGTPDS